MDNSVAINQMQRILPAPLWMRVPTRVREVMKWSGTVLFFIGSAVTAIWPPLALQCWPFSLFALGHTLWAIGGLLMRDRAVIGLNLMYLPFDLIAIATRI